MDAFHRVVRGSLVLVTLCGDAVPVVAAEPGKPAVTAKADAFAVGARVEVRRNGQWLPGTVVKRETGRVFVKYDGASDNFNEWIPNDQLREPSVVTATGPGAGPAAPPPTTSVPPAAATKPVAQAPAVKAKPDPFAVGAEIEAMWGSHWYEATVLSRDGDKAEVQFSDVGRLKQTVGPKEMRTRGVTPEVAAKLSGQGGLFAVGARVEAQFGSYWYDATISRRNATEVELKTDDGFTHRVSAGAIRTRAVSMPPPAAPVAAANPAAPAAPAASAGDQFRVGEKIEVQWGNSWWPATVIQRNGPKAKIHYANHTDNWDEWVGPERMRPIGGEPAVAAAAAPKAPAAATSTPPPAAPASTVPAAPAAPNPFAPDASGARVIAFAKPPGGWVAAPDPTTKPARPLPAQVAPLPLPPMAATEKAGVQNALWQSVSDVIVPPGDTQGVVVHTQDGPRVPYVTQVERVDFVAGSVSQSIGMPEGLEVVDASPDGRRLLMRERAARGMAEVWSIEIKEGLPLPAKLKMLQPFSGPFTTGAFVDADHVVFVSESHDVAMVDVNALKVAWTCKAGGPMRYVAISPGRGQMAIPTDLGVFLVEPLSGAPLGLLEGIAPGSAYMTFSPDGRRLAAVDRGLVSVWNLETGVQWRTFDINTVTFAGGERQSAATVGHRVDWCGNDYLMFGGVRLVSIPWRATLWNYVYPDTKGRVVTTGAAGKFWYLAAEPPKDRTKVVRRSLVPVTMPEQRVTDLAAQLHPTTLYAWYPGMKVSLSVNVGGDDQEKITKSLTASLKNAGMVIADDAPVRLEASSAAGESKTTEYESRRFGFGGPPARETHSVTTTSTILRLAIVDNNGKALWEQTTKFGGFASPFLHVREGQTAQEAADAQNRGNNNSFFYNKTLPQYLPAARETDGFGQSALTLKGVVFPVPVPEAKE